MKKISFLLFGLAWFCCGQAQDEAYKGGSADGSALGFLITPFGFSNNYSPFLGGAGDGNSRDEIVTPLGPANHFAPFIGGEGDGYSRVELVTPFGFANNFSPFLGGEGDGYSGISFINQVFAFPHQFYTYFGGSNDGWTGYLQPGVIILPVTLFQFRGEEFGEMNRLHWITEFETNTDKFSVERSADGTRFTNLSSLSAAGFTSGRKDYQLLDSLPLTGRNFYRIRMWDKDGSSKLSPVILIERKDMFRAIVVYPNPVQSQLRVRLYQPLTGEITWRITDLQGRKVLEQKTPGNNELYQVNIGHLSAGSYLLEARFGSRVETIRFIKQ